MFVVLLSRATIQISARGPSPNTAFVGSLGSSTLSSSGFIKVKPTLQLVDHPRIFAAGDVIDWREQKQAAKAGAHAKVVVQNVLNVLAGKKAALVSYQGSPELIVIINGRVSRFCSTLCNALTHKLCRMAAWPISRSLVDSHWETFGRGC